jgi:hypothetical protein
MSTATHNRPELTPQWRLAIRLRDALLCKRCRCSHRKVAGQTFCKDCYYALPDQMREDLSKKIMAGYEEAYQRACDFLDTQKRKEAR